MQVCRKPRSQQFLATALEIYDRLLLFITRRQQYLSGKVSPSAANQTGWFEVSTRIGLPSSFSLLIHDSSERLVVVCKIWVGGSHLNS